MKKTPLERLLGLVADIRRDEAYSVLLLSLNVFVLMAGYYLLKTARESLILTEGGAAVKSYSSAAQAGLLLILIPAFSQFASRVNRMTLITWVLLFFAVDLVIFFLVGRTGVPVGIVFYIWVGIFNVMAVAQFWSFANDLFSESQGKRLFPAIGVGSTVGAWLGALAAEKLIKAMGPLPLMLVAAAMLLVCIRLTRVAHHRNEGEHDLPEKKSAPVDGEGAFRLLISDRYLLWLAILSIVLNVVNSSGEFLLSSLAVQGAHDAVGAAGKAAQQKWIGAFYANFFAWDNWVTFLLQTFFVYRIFKYVGVGRSLFILPMIAAGGYSLILLRPALNFVRTYKIIENSTDYSLQNTAGHALFLPTSRAAKYKAKQVVDSLGRRLGDVIQAGIVRLGEWGEWELTRYALVSLVLTGVWIGVTVVVSRRYRERTEIRRPGAVPVLARQPV